MSAGQVERPEGALAVLAARSEGFAQGFAEGWRAAHQRVLALLGEPPPELAEGADRTPAVVARAEAAPRRGRPLGEWLTAGRREVAERMMRAGVARPGEIVRAMRAVDPEVWMPANGTGTVYGWIKRRGAELGLPPVGTGAGADDVLAAAMRWAEGVDPDLVLRGSAAARLGQIKDLRKLEGLRPFEMSGGAA